MTRLPMCSTHEFCLVPLPPTQPLLFLKKKFSFTLLVVCLFFSFSFFIIFLGEKHILVPTFLGYSHFSPYILFLPLLVPILKKVFCFGPYRYIKNGKS